MKSIKLSLILFIALIMFVIAIAPITQKAEILPATPGNAQDLALYCNVTDTDSSQIAVEYRLFRNDNIILWINHTNSTQTSFNDSSSGTITFTDNENHTKYLELPRYSNIISATLNLTGQEHTAQSTIIKNSDFSTATDWNYAENDTDYTGAYLSSPDGYKLDIPETVNIDNSASNELSQNINFTNLDRVIFDLEWTSLGSGSEQAELWADTNLEWSSTTSYDNESHTEDWSAYSGTGNLKFRIQNLNAPPGTTNYATFDWFYIIRNIRELSYPHDPYLVIGTPTQVSDWSQAGSFESEDQSAELSDAINTALNNGACDCTGCVLSGNNCTIPFIFHSDTIGKLDYDVINVQYIEPGYANNTNNNVFNYSSDNTNVGEQYILSCRGYDGTDFSAWVNSTAVTITSQAPVILTATVTPDPAYTNDTLKFNCKGSDADGQDLNYGFIIYNNSYSSVDFSFNTNIEYAWEYECSTNFWAGATPCDEAYDGDWSWTGTPAGADASGNDATLTITYKKNPNWNASTQWLVADNLSLYNTTLNITQSCWDNDPDELYFRVISHNEFAGTDYVRWQCGTNGKGGWTTLRQFTGNQWVYEEALQPVYEPTNFYPENTEINVFNISSSDTIKNQNWTISCIAFDNSSYSNYTSSSILTISNSLPIISNFLIVESGGNLTFTNTTTDTDSDTITDYSWVWYINGAINSTYNNQTEINASDVGLDTNWTVEMQAYDGQDWSLKYNSSTYVSDDNVSPVLSDDSLSASSGTNDAPFTIYVNVTEENSLAFVRVEVIDPNSNRQNWTMSVVSQTGDEYAYSRIYTPSTDGVYNFTFYAQDGSGNLGTLISNLTYTESTSGDTIVTGGGGGGAPETKVDCNIMFNKDEIILRGTDTETIQIFNNHTESFTPNVVLSEELASLQFTIPVDTIITGQFGELNIINQDEELIAQGTITITSTNCNDIVLPVDVAPGIFQGDFLGKELLKFGDFSFTNLYLILLSLIVGIAIAFASKNFKPGTKIAIVIGVVFAMVIIFNAIFG